MREPWALRRRYVSATGPFARYGERYMSASRCAYIQINAISATTFATVYNYSRATSLVSFKLINIKRIEEKKTALSISTQDMMWHKLQVSMCATQHCCDAVANFTNNYSAQNLLLQNQRLGIHRH